MKNLQRTLESLNHLSVFEASARLGSFTLAAAELGISQPAVSQSVRRLEAAIGIKLFKRNHRIISLTNEGQVLKDDVSQSLNRISATIEMLQRQGKSKHVTLLVSSAFAHYWMVPRLQNFHKINPDIDLRMQQTDMDIDLSEGGISLAVRRGNGQWRGYESELLADESIRVLASPKWIAENPPITTLDDLKSAQLITLEEPHRDRPKWEDFFAAFGARYTDKGTGLRLNDYTLVLQAALAGEGVAFGWGHVTRHLIATGQLTPIDDWCWKTGLGFYLVWSQNAVLTTDAIATKDWIISVKG